MEVSRDETAVVIEGTINEVSIQTKENEGE